MEKAYSIIMQQVNTARNTPHTRSTSPKAIPNQTATFDKYDALEKIAKLKEQGILTEEEFQLEKERILKM